MNGPIKKPKIGLGLGALELWSVIFGLIVVVGVLLESGPEILQSARQLRIPSHVVTGGAMVALGVFGEVAIGIFIARSAKREQIESSERVAKAEQAAAEANLETVRIKERLADRRVNAAQASLIGMLLAAFTGKTLKLLILDDNETLRFANEMVAGFERAGIEVLMLEMSPGGIDPGLALLVGQEGDKAFADAIENALSVAGLVKPPMGRIHLGPPGEAALRIGPK